MTKKNQERRNLGRKDLSAFFPTVFSYQNREHRALLINLSSTGGKFQLQYVPQELELSVGDTLDLEIRTDRGILNVPSEISWVGKKGAYFSWGARFIQLSPEQKKTIQAILDDAD